jgi:hypothetical protein
MSRSRTLPDAQALINYGGVLDIPAFNKTLAPQSGLEDTSFDFSGLGLDVTSPANSFMEVVVRIVSGSGAISDGSVSSIELGSQGDLAGINAFIDGLNFLGAQDWNGTATIEISVNSDYRANQGGQIATLSFDINVGAINDAPTRLAPSAALATINEDAANPAGAKVSTLFGSAFSDALDQVASGSSADALAGVAITGNAADPSTGHWQYSTNGSAWTNLPSVSASSAFIVAQGHYLRFLPSLNYHGAPGALTARLIDDAHGPATTGSTANVSNDTTLSGGSTSYADSSNAVTLTTTVTAVNDAPTTADLALAVAKNHTLTFSLSSLDVDGGTNNTNDAVVNRYQIVTLPGNGVLKDGSGNAVTAGAIITVAQATNMSFVPTANYQGPASFTFKALDAANASSTASTATITVTPLNEAPVVTVPGAASLNEDASLTLSGISLADSDAGGGVEQVTVSAAHGVVTLSQMAGLTVVAGANGSASVSVQGTLAAINAALNNLGYAPNANYNGTDQVTVAMSDLGNTGPAPQTDSKTIAITINPVDDAPVTGSAQLVAVNEDTLNPDGETVSDILANYTDVDGHSLIGIAISANPNNPAQGVWQYSLDDGQTWAAVGTVSLGSALMLDVYTKLRFVPTANYSGQPDGLVIHAVDNSATQPDIRLFTVTVPLTVDLTLLPADIAAAGVTLDTTGTAVDGDFGASVRDLVASQYGSAVSGIAISAEASTSGKGAWEYSLDGQLWIPLDNLVQPLGTATALLLSSNAFLRFVRVTGYEGAPVNLTVHGVDLGNRPFTTINRMLDVVSSSDLDIDATGTTLGTTITPTDDPFVVAVDKSPTVKEGASVLITDSHLKI